MNDKVYLGLDFYIGEDDEGHVIIKAPTEMNTTKAQWHVAYLAYLKILRLQQAVKDLADGASIDWTDLYRYGLESKDLD